MVWNFRLFYFFTLFSKFIVIWWLFQFTCVLIFSRGGPIIDICMFPIRQNERKIQSMRFNSHRTHIRTKFTHEFFLFIFFTSQFFLLLLLIELIQRQKRQLHKLRTQYQHFSSFFLFNTLWPICNITTIN